MTEAEWESCTDPQAMLDWLRHAGKASDRKLRLFGVACCRGILDWIRDSRARTAVDVSKRFADGTAGRGELAAACSAAEAAFYQTARLVGGDDPTFPTAAVVAYFAAWYTALPDAGEAAVGSAAMSSAECLCGEPEEGTRRRQCDLAREVFGTPFRPLQLDPSWQTADVVGLAGHVYYDRAFGHMPELADLLHQAGCTNAALLSHLRGPGPHYRGCFAVDLLRPDYR